MKLPLLALAIPLSSWACAQTPDRGPDMTVTHLNPDDLHANPAFTQVIAVAGPHTTVYVGGQNAVTADGRIVGEGDIGAQAAQVAKNLVAALHGAGASPEHVVKWTIYAVDGQPIGPAMGGFMQVLGALEKPPTISVVFVAGLANPAFLIEVEAVAVVPG